MGAEKYHQRLKRWRFDERGILQFGQEELAIQHYDPWQEEALLAFASPKPEHQRISLQACAGPGKSFVLAVGGLWFLGCKGQVGEHPNGAVTSVTKDNLKGNLWKEYAKWIARSPYMSSQFTWTSSRIFANDHPATWFLDARSWPKGGNADEQGATLSGLHGKYVLVEVDESGSIPTTILRAGEQALAQASGGFSKIIQAGNPISLEGMLYAAASTLRTQWYVIRITGDPDDPRAWVHSPRVGTKPLEHAKLQIATYGRDNPWVKAYILGQFPPSSINTLLGIEDVEAAMARHYTEDKYNWAQKRIGVDVARFGDDRTVLAPRQGLTAFPFVVMRNVRTTAIAARIAQGINRWGAEMTLVDDTGHWGHGVIDNLIAGGYPAIGIIVSDEPINPRYRNRRAEMWMEMAEWVKNGGALPPVPELVAELTTPTYTFNNGKFQLEDKDQIKERLGRSPDLADALSLTFSMPDMPAALQRATGAAGQRARASRDGDPYGQAASNTSLGQALRDQDPYNTI